VRGASSRGLAADYDVPRVPLLERSASARANSSRSRRDAKRVLSAHGSSARRIASGLASAGGRARFTIRFWNLDDQELQRLIWCVVLEPGLAHKIGNNRYLGFGSLRLSIQPESFLINWANRYADRSESSGAWRMPIRINDWLKPNAIAYHSELVTALDAKRL